MVAASSTNLRVIGDEDSSKRRQIIEGARKVFMDLGFDGASMGEIARAAGVSKGTLYVYFADKSRLFEAIVEDETLMQGKISFNFDPGRDVITTLTEFGQAYIAMICRCFEVSSSPTTRRLVDGTATIGLGSLENLPAENSSEGTPAL